MKLSTKIWILAGTAIFCCLMLIIFFSIGELDRFIWLDRVNHEKIANFFTSLEAICVVATLVFASWQFEESRKANDAARLASINSNAPNLRPSQVDVEIIDANPWGQLGNWLSADDGFVVPKSITPHLFELKNSGKGVANDVKVEWIFDEFEIEKILKEDYNKDRIQNIYGDSTTEVAFIEPGSSANLRLCVFYLLAWASDAGALSFLDLLGRDYPPCTLRISYQELSGSRSSDDFQVSVIYSDMNRLTLNFVRTT